MLNTQGLMQAGNLLSTLYQTQQQNTKREVVTVNGVSEAQAFRLDKGESIALIDCNADVLYIKESDDVGKTTMRIYECIDKTDEYISKNTPAQISKADFDNLNKKLNNLTELLTKGVNNVTQKQKE